MPQILFLATADGQVYPSAVEKPSTDSASGGRPHDEG